VRTRFDIYVFIRDKNKYNKTQWGQGCVNQINDRDVSIRSTTGMCQSGQRQGCVNQINDRDVSIRSTTFYCYWKSMEIWIWTKNLVVCSCFNALTPFTNLQKMSLLCMERDILQRRYPLWSTVRLSSRSMHNKDIFCRFVKGVSALKQLQTTKFFVHIQISILFQ
jgi:hypothetical protein